MEIEEVMEENGVVVCNLIFEDEDNKLYNDLLEIAEAKNMTMQELINEILSEACLN